MDAVQKANAGHPGTAMALAPLAYLLYRDVMRHNPADPHWPGRDRFVLSAGHACILQYASLHLAGYDLTLDDLKQFRQWGSRTPGHPEHGHTAGIETTTGPLGQGFANGVGMAIAQRFLADRYNRPHHEIVDSWIYAICSDGDMMEGVSSRGGVDRRPPRARPARLRLRRQPHHDRRHDVAHVHDRGQGQALRGVRLARPARRRLRGSRRAARRARGGQGRGGAPVADRPAQPHRLSGAARGRHGEGARRPARRGRGPGDEGGHGLRSRRDVRRLRRRARAHGGRRRARRRAAARVGGAPGRLGRQRSRSWRGSASSTCAASRARAGARRCPCSRPARRSRRATPAAR